MSIEGDVELICDAAMQWAGEYGYSNPDEATEVIEAVERIQPDIAEHYRNPVSPFKKFFESYR